MHSQFNTLYRQLCQSDALSPNKSKRSKDNYDNERKQVLQVLYKEDRIVAEKPVDRPSHHGKFARFRANDKRQEAITIDSTAEAKKKKDLFDTVQGINQMNSLTKEVKGYLQRKQAVPNVLLKQLAPPSTTFDGSSKNGTNITTASVLSGRTVSAVQPQHVSRLDRRLPQIIRRDYTDKKWDKRERVLMNTLYNEIERPKVSAHSKELWKIYYEKIASRFIQFYPHRKYNDIIEKFEDMVIKRQMKEVGEAEYWDNTFNRTQSSATNTSSVGSIHSNTVPTIATANTAVFK